MGWIIVIGCLACATVGYCVGWGCHEKAEKNKEKEVEK
jgi:hypothetical protein